MKNRSDVRKSCMPDAVIPARVFTLSVGDRPVLAFQATRLSEARELIQEEWLHDDLVGLTSELVPLWDRTEKLSVRGATDEETARYLESAKAAETGDLVLAYLVELD